MSKTEHNNFGQKLAFHTAPTLLGIKCASLISLSSNEFDLEANCGIFNQRAYPKGLKSRILCKCGNRTLMLVYNRKLLEKCLSDSGARHLLKECGYSEKFSVEECLDRLSERIGTSADFPHEVGIFLGYPTEDVVGFIENKGENFKLCGCWKVYGCEESARRTFANYEKCRKFLCNKLNEGTDIYQALKLS